MLRFYMRISLLPCFFLVRKRFQFLLLYAIAELVFVVVPKLMLESVLIQKIVTLNEKIVVCKIKTEQAKWKCGLFHVYTRLPKSRVSG